MTNDDLDILLEKLKNGQCTEEELFEIDALYNEVDRDRILELPQKVTSNIDKYVSDRLKLLEGIIAQRQARLKVRKLKLYKIAAAVVLLLTISSIVYRSTRETNRPAMLNSVSVNDVQPGHSGAILLLSDGSKIVLDSAGSGLITNQGNVQVTNDKGVLTYNGNARNLNKLVYNTLSTPKGRQYTLVLPDGSKVWLNAASSIKYPVSFGTERKVEITGEAYFKIVHNAAKPFKVLAGKTEIIDIGTEFNVYAYGDEQVLKTTLLEGAVKVNGRLLDPGQQAQVDKNAQIKVINLPNAEDVIAWKRGLINFNATDIPALLRQIGRWYNIEVQIKGKLPDIYLTGTIPRNTKLSSVVKILDLNNLKCSIQGNRLLISAK